MVETFSFVIKIMTLGTAVRFIERSIRIGFCLSVSAPIWRWPYRLQPDASGMDVSVPNQQLFLPIYRLRSGYDEKKFSVDKVKNVVGI